jgi:hypothetical protein
VASGDVICEECGETNKPGSEFCMFCGAYLGWQEKQNPAGTNEVTQPLPSQPTAAPSEQAPSRSATAARTQPQAQPGTQTLSAQPTPPQNPTAARAVAPQGPAITSPQPGAAATGQPQPNIEQPMATAVAGVPTAPAAAAVPTCPTCGRPVTEGRRFCAHCGHQLIGPGSGAAGAAAARQTAKRDSWWSRLWDSKERSARRAYRRSLPPLYRWRRVIIAVIALGLVGGLLTLIGYGPKAFVMARYYDLRKTLVAVTPVTPAIIPPEASADNTQPGALVDQTAAAWQMNWSDTTQGSACGATPTTPVIELTFARTRIRQIDMRAGLLDNNPNRLAQFRPQNIWIAYADQCVPISLADAERQPIALDTKIGVTSIRIGVQSAYQPTQPAGAQQVLGFTEITLLARPTR